MKALLLILLPVLIFGQTVAYNDTLITKSGKVYVGAITEIENDAVNIIRNGDLKKTLLIIKNTRLMRDPAKKKLNRFRKNH